MTDDENLDQQEQEEPKTQTETAGGPPLPPRKTALDYSSEGDKREIFSLLSKLVSKKIEEKRAAQLADLVEKRLKGEPWTENNLQTLQRFNITREEVDAEVRRRGGQSSE